MQASSDRLPVVSIGMPVFNNAETIAQAISSILHQTFEEWELLIVDDGSSDKTLEIAVSFNDPRIIVTKGDENKRLSARLNECISKARGKFFARMDGDDVAYPERLQYQVDFLQSHPEVDLLAGWAVVFHSDGTAFCTLRGSLTHEEIWARPWMGMLMPHSTWMGRIDWFRRDHYNNVELLEDQDLLFRTYHRSRFATLPHVVLGYREDRRSLPKHLFQRWQLCKSIVRKQIQQRQFMNVAMCLAGHTAKGLAEIVALSAGLTYHIFQPGATAISINEATRWRSVWNTVDISSRNHHSECSSPIQK
jgi:glycosyltransferase involved in cell wall biosynthesis